MPVISIKKKDVFWTIFGKSFLLLSSFITLPIVLRLLSEEEIALNYLMMTIASLVNLIDFGFTPMFSRNFTYIYSGAHKLLPEGLDSNASNNGINYHLLSVLINSAKYVYRRLATVSLFLMLLLGTIYIYTVTSGFTAVNGALYIWISFSISTFFGIYFAYYNCLLVGSGRMEKANKATILSKTAYVLISISGLYAGLGLFSIVLATLISPFVQRYYTHCVYFTEDLVSKLDKVSTEEIRQQFKTIWYNAKKLGLTSLGSFALSKSSLFMIGLFLPLSDVASYGLMVQVLNVISMFANILLVSYSPQLSSFRVQKKDKELLGLLSMIVIVFWAIMISGYLGTIFVLPHILSFIGSNAVLPAFLVISVYTLHIALEGNHCLFVDVIVAKNEIPFVKAALLSGFGSLLLLTLLLRFTNLGLIGVVFAMFIAQVVYNNWRWPVMILKEFNCGILSFIKHGIKYSKNLVLKRS